MYKPVRWPDYFRLKVAGEKYLTVGNLVTYGPSTPKQANITLENKNNCTLNQVWTLNIAKHLVPQSFIDKNRAGLARSELDLGNPKIFLYETEDDAVQNLQLSFFNITYQKEVLQNGENVIITLEPKQNVAKQGKYYLIYNNNVVSMTQTPYDGQDGYLWTLETVTDTDINNITSPMCATLGTKVEGFNQFNDNKKEVLFWLVLFFALFILLKR